MTNFDFNFYEIEIDGQTYSGSIDVTFTMEQDDPSAGFYAEPVLEYGDVSAINDETGLPANLDKDTLIELIQRNAIRACVNYF